MKKSVGWIGTMILLMSLSLGMGCGNDGASEITGPDSHPSMCQAESNVILDLGQPFNFDPWHNNFFDSP